MKKILQLLIVFFVALLIDIQAVCASPTADLRPILDELTAVLGDESLKGKEHLVERREKIMTNIKRGFDFREMSKRVLGRTWKKIDDNDRDYFSELMTKFLENVYVGKLESYSGQTVQYDAEAVKGNRAQVTTIINNGGVSIPVHYVMRKTEAKWMVYDINIEGVSLVRNYQEQFKSILRKDKFVGLVKVLEDKNRSFLEETE